jgi:hypothetical protein
MRFTIGRKLTLSSLAFAIPIAALFVLEIGAMQSYISFASLEVEGDTYLAPLVRLMADAQKLARGRRPGEFRGYRGPGNRS